MTRQSRSLFDLEHLTFNSKPGCFFHPLPTLVGLIIGVALTHSQPAFAACAAKPWHDAVIGKVLKYNIESQKRPTCKCLRSGAVEREQPNGCVVTLSLKSNASFRATVYLESRDLCKRAPQSITGSISNFECFDQPDDPGRYECGSSEWLYLCTQAASKFQVSGTVPPVKRSEKSKQRK